MSKEVIIQLSHNCDVTIEWGGDFNGVCCGPQERLFKERLAQFGVKLTPKSVFCRLPLNYRQIAQERGICIKEEG